MTIRFAILTAVSSKAQASSEKVSLDEQERLCRKAGLTHGWEETSGPYVISGHTRTSYVNLRDAEADMPPLRKALDDAQQGLYDVLVIYDFSRLRDLMTLVYDTLVGYRVQLYPISSPIEPVEPGQYDATVADAVMYLLAGSSMSSRAEINALRRRHKLGMPGRVTKKGLHPQGPSPFGYRKPLGQEFNRAAVLEPDPAIAAALVQAKEMFLKGASTPQIAEHLTRMAIPTSRGKKAWHPDTLRYILTNPFYAGILTYNKTSRRMDRRTRAVTIHANPDDQVVTATGKHNPLWTVEEHRRILDEFERRGKSYTGRRASRHSRLLYCPCGKMLWVSYTTWKNNPPSEHNRHYFCSGDRSRKLRDGHTYIKERDIIRRIAEQVSAEISAEKGVTLPEPVDRRPSYQVAIDELLRRKSNLTDALELGSLSPTDYADRVGGINKRIAELQRSLLSQADAARKIETRRQQIDELAEVLAAVPDYLLEAPAQEVNASLRAVLEKIIVHPSGDIELVWS